MLALGLFFSTKRRAPRTSAVVVADAEAGLAQNICSPSRGEKIFDYAGEKAEPVVNAPPVGEVNESVTSACEESALPGPEEEVEAPRWAGDVHLAEEEVKQEEWHETHSTNLQNAPLQPEPRHRQ